VARHALTSRALDDAEETTNRNRASVPREHLVLYQFSARGHDVAQCVLGALLDHPHDAAGAYYRSRPLLLSLGLSAEDALASPLGRSAASATGATSASCATCPAAPARWCCRWPATSAASTRPSPAGRRASSTTATSSATARGTAR
jgi:2-oxoisovalerate dehydrogenase E1 component